MIKYPALLLLLVSVSAQSHKDCTTTVEAHIEGNEALLTMIAPESAKLEAKKEIERIKALRNRMTDCEVILTDPYFANQREEIEHAYEVSKQVGMKKGVN